MENLDAEIIQAVAEPSSTTTDGLTVVNRSFAELIAMDNHVKNKTALSGPNANGGRKSAWGKLRMAQVVPPGTS